MKSIMPKMTKTREPEAEKPPMEKASDKMSDQTRKRPTPRHSSGPRNSKSILEKIVNTVRKRNVACTRTVEAAWGAVRSRRARSGGERRAAGRTVEDVSAGVSK